MFFVVCRLRARPGRKAGADGPGGRAASRQCPGQQGVKPAKSKAPAADDDLGDVADILRRHNIH